MQKTISGEIGSILNENKMTSTINDVKKIMTKYNTNDLGLITKLQKRDDIRILAIINITMENRPVSRKKFCQYNQVYSTYASAHLNSLDIATLLSSSKNDDFQKILLISQVSNVNTLDLNNIPYGEMFNESNIKKMAML